LLNRTIFARADVVAENSLVIKYCGQAVYKNLFGSRKNLGGFFASAASAFTGGLGMDTNFAGEGTGGAPRCVTANAVAIPTQHTPISIDRRDIPA
jgi:hypothetical protein